MDTAAYLSRQGWRGDGHALHHSGRGITKPIHISQKTNGYGIGKKKHDAHADQWWARAFDDTLKGLNTTKDDTTGKTEGISLGASARGLHMVGRVAAGWVGQGGLYSNFVRGESLTGTLTSEEQILSREGDQKGVMASNEAGDGVQEEPLDRKRKKQKLHDQGKTGKVPKSIAGEPVVQDVEHPRSGRRHDRLQDNPGITESKEDRRQRRRERKAKKARRISNSEQELPQPSASLNESAGSKTGRREKIQNRTGLLLDGANDPPVDIAKRFRRKNKRIVNDGNG